MGRRAASCRPSAIRAALRRVTLAGRGVPALVGAAFKNKGIHNLLDAVVDYLPSPADIAEMRGRDPVDPASARPTLPTLVAARSATSEPLAALAFKVQIDDRRRSAHVRPRLHRLLRVGDSVLNATKGHREQIGRLVRMFANHREDIRQIEAGMIGAVVVDAAPASSRPATRCAIARADPARRDDDPRAR